MAKLTAENFAKLLSDVNVVEALTKALMPALEAALEKTWGPRLRAAEASILALKEDNVKLTERLGVSEERLTASGKRIEALEVDTRRDTIMFSGLEESSFAERASPGGSTVRTPDGSYAACEDSAIKFCRDHLKVSIEPQDISSAYRLKAKNPGANRPLVVRFRSVKVRDAVYRARTALKGSQLKVFLSEHLSRRNSELFYEARQSLKAKKISSVWTQGGRVYYKTTNNLEEKPKAITDFEDLP
jgi:hypothetical protein